MFEKLKNLDVKKKLKPKIFQLSKMSGIFIWNIRNNLNYLKFLSASSLLRDILSYIDILFELHELVESKPLLHDMSLCTIQASFTCHASFDPDCWPKESLS